MKKEELQQKIKELIINTLNLEDFTVSDIETDAPLFREGLGLDSIDALELGLAVKKTFNVTMKAESEEMRAYFYSVATLADYIISQRSDLVTQD